MKTVFHAWADNRFIEIQGSFRGKKLHWLNQGSNFLGCSFSNRDNVGAPIQEKLNPSLLKDYFSSMIFHINRTKPYFTIQELYYKMPKICKSFYTSQSWTNFIKTISKLMLCKLYRDQIHRYYMYLNQKIITKVSKNTGNLCCQKYMSKNILDGQ